MGDGMGGDGRGVWVMGKCVGTVVRLKINGAVLDMLKYVSRWGAFVAHSLSPLPLPLLTPRLYCSNDHLTFYCLEFEFH